MTKICSLKTTLDKTISGIERILKMWRRRNLTLERNIIIFKTLALSKVTFLLQVLVIPNQIIDPLQQIQKDFYGFHLPRKWNMKSFTKIFNMES